MATAMDVAELLGKYLEENGIDNVDFAGAALPDQFGLVARAVSGVESFEKIARINISSNGGIFVSMGLGKDVRPLLGVRRIRTNFHDPDSFPKILAFIGKYFFADSSQHEA